MRFTSLDAKILSVVAVVVALVSWAVWDHYHPAGRNEALNFMRPAWAANSDSFRVYTAFGSVQETLTFRIGANASSWELQRFDEKLKTFINPNTQLAKLRYHVATLEPMTVPDGLQLLKSETLFEVKTAIQTLEQYNQGKVFESCKTVYLIFFSPNAPARPFTGDALWTLAQRRYHIELKDYWNN